MSESTLPGQDSNQESTPQRVDPKELDLPETVYVRDIENRVFQGIVLQCLAKINGVSLLEGNLIDNILGRGSLEGIKGIHAEQDEKNHSISVRVEVNICYGISIPEKADEIQSRIVEDLTNITGLHVSNVHVIFKNLILMDPNKPLIHQPQEPSSARYVDDDASEEYTDEF